MSGNDALNDEFEALSSIYGSAVLELSSATSTGDIPGVLTLPTVAYSFSVTFSPSYPDEPPQILGTHHVAASAKKGEGEAAASILRDVLGRLFTPGQVCLFDLIEEATPLLTQHHQANVADGTAEISTEHSTPRPASPRPVSVLAAGSPLTASVTAASSTALNMPSPDWAVSEPLVVNKSTFVARCLPVHSLSDATSAISHLLATNKRVAAATHNITAWRIRNQENEGDPEIVIQDSDDDGETAAGGRLLYLMQLVDVWNVVVVVTRWYGGVKLGPDRFKCINKVAREALEKGGFVAEEKEKGSGKKGKK